MKAFTYNALPGRVVFGSGALEKVGEEVERLGARCALVLSTPEQRKQAEDVARRLGDRAAGVHDGAVMHTPIESIHTARDVAKQRAADCAVAVGGGSTIGLGKALTLELGLPVLAIPTTYAGSEMTPILGITQSGVKKTMRELRLLPKVVIYDPHLTLTLPVGLSATSAMNAIAHCVEALYAQDANPVISLQAEEGIRALAQGLPLVVQHPNDLEARSDMLYGAWLAGAALGAVGMALHHKLCHTLGGSFNLPHAETHTVVLPHAVAYNTTAAPEAMARVCRALGVNNAAQGLYDLAQGAGAPVSLKQIGMPADGLDRAAELAVQSPYYNPRPIEKAAIRALLEDAFHGRRPQ